MNLEQLGISCLALIKNASYFPYKSGRLRDLATSGTMFTDTCYRIQFNSAIAPYVVYLEEGTKKSTKHKGFIKDKCVVAIVDFICAKYGGKAVVV